MNKVWIGIGVLIFIALGVVVMSNGITGLFTSNANEKIKIADIPVTEGIPLYLAVENGYFKDEGLDVEIVKFDSPKQIIDAVVLNQVDLSGPNGATGISAIAESLQPGNLKYYGFSCHYNDNGSSLVVKANSNISSIRELEGKKIGKLPAIQWTTIVRRALKVNGVDVNKTTLVDLALGLQLQALETGQVDALVALDPIGQIAVEKGIGKIIMAGVIQKSIADPACNGAGIVSTKFIAERPETARKVMRAMAKAFETYHRTPESQSSLLAKYLKMEPKIAEKMPFPLANFTMSSDLTLEQKTAIQKFIDMFYEDGIMQKRVNVEEVLIH